MSRVKPPKAALLASADDVEAQFYEALQQGDLARLMAAWGDDDETVCVRPGGLRAVGGAAIRAGFEAMLAKGGVPALPERVRRLHALGLAVHHLVERLRLPADQGGGDAFVLTTNVYVHTAQGWRLVAHHASPGHAEPPAAAQEWPSTLH